ncbi:hypothetical protein V6N11_056676 [Hibiscus sabdariffa]|uniref:Uncharacterized protein n=1 Tax=Hibiscus sabdariffa TaxID=183260 RepID=A0ABR2T5H3_9ROSI
MLRFLRNLILHVLISILTGLNRVPKVRFIPEEAQGVDLGLTCFRVRDGSAKRQQEGQATAAAALARD